MVHNLLPSSPPSPPSITQYVNGGALEQLIQDKSIDLPVSLRLQLTMDIAQGMDYLHRNSMLHRDLNSKNCLLRKQGTKYTAVVADFGLAASAPMSTLRYAIAGWLGIVLTSL